MVEGMEDKAPSKDYMLNHLQKLLTYPASGFSRSWVGVMELRYRSSCVMRYSESGTLQGQFKQSKVKAVTSSDKVHENSQRMAILMMKGKLMPPHRMHLLHPTENLVKWAKF